MESLNSGLNIAKCFSCFPRDAILLRPLTSSVVDRFCDVIRSDNLI